MNDRLYSNAKAFVTTMRTGSISAAAIDLNTTKSSVSQKVSNFEVDLGLKLFERSGRSIVPTAAGKRIFEICVPMVDAALEAEAQLIESESEDLSGRIAIAGPNGFLTNVMLPFIIEFSSNYPNVNIVLKASDWFVDFEADDIDIGFRIGAVPKGQFNSQKLFTTQRLLCASPSLIAKFDEIKSPKDLVELPCILRQQESKTWRLRGPNGEIETITPSQVMLVDTAELSLASTIAGAGIALLPILLAQPEVKSGKLEPVLPHWYTELMDVLLLSRPSSLRKPQVAALRRFFIERCSDG